MVPEVPSIPVHYTFYHTFHVTYTTTTRFSHVPRLPMYRNIPRITKAQCPFTDRASTTPRVPDVTRLAAVPLALWYPNPELPDVPDPHHNGTSPSPVL